MAIEITHVRLSGSRKIEEEIIRYRLKTIGKGPVGESDKPSLVAWVETNSGAAFVESGAERFEITVLRPSNGQPYLRARARGSWMNGPMRMPA